MAESDVPQKPRFEVENPLVLIFESEEDHSIITHLFPSSTCDSHEAFGLLVCDLVRHIARKFSVSESAVWDWVDRERKNPTTEITQAS